MKAALEALDQVAGAMPFPVAESARKNLRSAIEQAEGDIRCTANKAERQEPVAWEDVLGAIARGWAHPENARKPMDVELAVAIAKEIQDMYTAPPQQCPRCGKADPAEVHTCTPQEPVLVVEKEPDYMSRGSFHEGTKPHIDPTKVWALPIGTKLYTDGIGGEHD